MVANTLESSPNMLGLDFEGVGLSVTEIKAAADLSRGLLELDCGRFDRHHLKLMPSVARTVSD